MRHSALQIARNLGIFFNGGAGTEIANTIYKCSFATYLDSIKMGVAFLLRDGAYASMYERIVS